MIGGGSYSKKYQTIEKEKMKEIKDREKKFGKERSLFLSIQTAQRRKAMEEKKRAMAEAEEERRRKALEERRQSQQQATDRFRSAIGRIKFSKNPTPARKFILPVKSKTTRCSYLHKNPTGSLQLEPRLDQVMHKDDSNGEVNTERLAIGKEVEVAPTESPPCFNLQRKCPSLDDVFKGSGMHQFGSTKSSHTTAFDRRKSVSDSNLNALTQLKSQPQPGSGEAFDSAHIKGSETTIFHPFGPVSKDSTIKVAAMSPTLMCMDSNSVIQEEVSPNIPDSLNSSVAEPLLPNAEDKHAAVTCVDKNAMPSPHNQRNYEDFTCTEESDTSVTDSLEENSSTVESSKLKWKNSTTVATKQPIVGILKKNSSSNIPLMDPHDRSRFYSLPQNHKNSSNDTSKSQKRVRFSDQVERSVKNSSPVVMNITDPVQIELWKKVFPKDFSPRSVPNSAFTPKMRCSLSSNTASFYRMSKKPNVPTTVIEASPMFVASTALPHVDAQHKSDDQLDVQDVLDNRDKEAVAPHENPDLKYLDKTPTDSEINTMWDQIRQCLQDGRKVSVPPRVFNFRPPLENGRRTLTRPLTDSSTSTSTNSKLLNNRIYSAAPSSSAMHKNNMNYTTQKHLVYRQPRLQSHSDGIHPHPGHFTTQYALPKKQEPIFKNRLQPTMQPSSNEPSQSVSSHDGSVTNLSLEEQRLMQSIERINQRLKDHLQASEAPQLKTQYYYPVPPSTPPKRHQTHPMRVRGVTEAKESQSSNCENSRNHPAVPYHKLSSHITSSHIT